MFQVPFCFALTAREHEGALAHAVVVVHVLGAEVGAVDHQAALPARRPTVAFQEESGGVRKGEVGGGRGESGESQGTSWAVRGRGGRSNKETARRQNRRHETSQGKLFILCCDKVKVKHLEKHVRGWGIK